MPGAGFRTRGKKERKEIYDTFQFILGRNFKPEEAEEIKASLLNYVRSEVFVFIAKSDTDKNEFLRSK